MFLGPCHAKKPLEESRCKATIVKEALEASACEASLRSPRAAWV